MKQVDEYRNKKRRDADFDYIIGIVGTEGVLRNNTPSINSKLELVTKEYVDYRFGDLSDVLDTDNWDEAYSWGDHSIEGYLKSEIDPQFTAWLNTNPLGNFITGLDWNEIEGDQTLVNVSGFNNDVGYVEYSNLPQSDWNVSLSTSKSYIKNKPDLSELHSHTNKNILDNIISEGSGNIITTVERNKLLNIEENAEVNVQSDWNVIDISSDSYIRNKPADLTDLSLHNSTELNDIISSGSGEIITILERTKLESIEADAEVNVQSDWNQVNSSEDSFILNKPTDITDISLYSTDDLVEGISNLYFTEDRISHLVPYTVLEDVKDPTGFDHSNPNSLGDIAFDDVTRTFSHSVKTGEDNFYFYVKGDKIEHTSTHSVVIDDLEGLWYIYYDSLGTLIKSQTPWNYDGNTVFVAIIYWDSDNNKGFIGDERHGISMSWATHKYLHNSMGAAYKEGFTPSLTVDGDGSLDSNCEMQSISSGIFYDEDLINLNQEQISYELWYKQGNDLWRWDVASPSLVKMATTYPYYNSFDGTNWNLTEVQTNKYTLTHIFSTNRKGYTNKIILVMGEKQYNSKAEAQEGAKQEMFELTVGELPTPEFVEIASVIIETKASYTNTYSSRVISTEEGREFIDFRRNDRIGVGASVSNHNNLSGKQGGIVGEYYHLSLDGYDAVNSGDITDLNTHSVEELNDVTSAGSGIIITDLERTKLNGIEEGAEVNLWELYDPLINLRLPTSTEWDNERLSWSSNDKLGAFNSPLKLPLCGRRSLSSGSISDDGLYGTYWSSTVSGTNADFIYIKGVTEINNTYRATGFSVRLILDGTYTQSDYDNDFNGEYVTIDGKTYGYCYNSITNRIWLDRNMGADQVATSSTDSLSYGDLYQWGRATEGHEKRSSSIYDADLNGTATTSEPNTGAAWDSKFITGVLDWLYTQDATLWQGVGGTNIPIESSYLLEPKDKTLLIESKWIEGLNSDLTQLHDPITVTDSSEIDFILTGQNITASLITGSIDVLKLDSSVQNSLSLANSALQSGDNISLLTNDTGYLTSESDPIFSASAASNITDAGSGIVISSTERTKLNTIEEGAEVNVNADWNATTGDSLILNKPSLSQLHTQNTDTQITSGTTVLSVDSNSADVNVPFNLTTPAATASLGYKQYQGTDLKIFTNVTSAGDSRLYLRDAAGNNDIFLRTNGSSSFKGGNLRVDNDRLIIGDITEALSGAKLVSNLGASIGKMAAFQSTMGGIEIGNSSVLTPSIFILGYNRSTSSYNDLSFKTSTGNPGMVFGTDQQLVVTNDVIANDFILSSDKRLKKYIKSLNDNTDIKSFKFKDRDDDRLRYGVIAQELELTNPELVQTNKDGYKTVSYTDYLLLKMAEKDDKIADLEKRLNKLEQLIKIK